MPAKDQKTEKTLKILELLKNGKKNSEICKILGCSQVCISTIKARNDIKRIEPNKYDWKEIQKFYDLGNSLTECQKEFNICRATFRKAQKRKVFKARTQQEGAKIRAKKYGGHKVSDNTKEKIRNSINKKLLDGSWHYSFSKVRTHDYQSTHNGMIKMMGKWELEYAKYLDHMNIKWSRPKDKFYYEYIGLKSGKGYYTPDFYILDDKTFVEIKGYETDKDRAKWKWFPKHLKHKILKREELIQLGLTISNK